MHSLHTPLPSHGQRYKRNLPRHQCAAQCACPAGGQGGNPPWAMGFHGANRVSASSALLHWRRGEAPLLQGAVQVHSKFSAPSMRCRQQLSLRWQCRHAGGKTLPNQGVLAPWQAGSKTVVDGGTAAASAAHHCGRLRPFAALCRLLPYCVFRGRMNAK